MKKLKSSDNNTLQLEDVKLKVPGKLIISGEHAIVYGAPAIAMSTHQGVAIDVSQIAEPNLVVNFEGFTQVTFTNEQVGQIAEQIEHRFSAFQNNELAINKVLNSPEELILLCYHKIMQQYALDNSIGHKLEFNSDIPISSGMGSSAAVLLGVIKAFAKLYDLKIKSEEIRNLAQQLEHRQHGRSSGLDIGIIDRSGIYLVDSEKEWHPISKLPWPLYVIMTGKPESSTGECVAAAAKHFNPSLINEFSQCTMGLYSALNKKNITTAKSFIAENNKLLCKLGVVPEKTQQLINTLNANDIAAKISGAGSICGDKAGIVICLGDNFPACAHKLNLKYFIA
jgi:mevalonate kinase